MIQAFGEARLDTAPAITSYKFTGQEYDASIALYNYKARLYDPVIGRFITPDTFIPNPMNPQSVNRYTYALNNPLGYVDPSGNVPIWVAKFSVLGTNILKGVIEGAIIGAIAGSPTGVGAIGGAVIGGIIGGLALGISSGVALYSDDPEVSSMATGVNIGLSAASSVTTSILFPVTAKEEWLLFVFVSGLTTHAQMGQVAIEHSERANSVQPMTQPLGDAGSLRTFQGGLSYYRKNQCVSVPDAGECIAR